MRKEFGTSGGERLEIHCDDTMIYDLIHDIDELKDGRTVAIFTTL